MITSDPVGSHLPVLTAVGSVIKPARILETGCGIYSTPTFCDRTIYPKVECVHSYENNGAWVRRVKKLYKRVPGKLTFISYGNSIVDAIDSIDFEYYDLLFIDNGVSSEERVATIEKVALAKPQRALVLIHDFDTVAYQWAADPFEHLMVYYTQLPQTGILWNGNRLSAEQERVLTTKLSLDKIY